MRLAVFAGLMVASAPVAADEGAPDKAPTLRRVVTGDAGYVPRRTTAHRVVCVKCRSAHLPWGGLRPVRKATLPWGGLPNYCPPVISRSTVVVTKG